MISTLTIDALGTLLRMEPPAPRLREQLLQRGVEVSEERAQQAFSREIAYYLTHHVEGRDPDSLEQLRNRWLSARERVSDASEITSDFLSSLRADFLDASSDVRTTIREPLDKVGK